MRHHALARYPAPTQLPRLLLRPDAPVVMVNLLVFKAMATGSYHGRTGREAYQDYAAAAEAAQRSMGSRLLWSGECQQRLSAAGPECDVIAMLEYASPRAFLSFAKTGGGKADARAAGLHGQLLIAATTLEFAPAHDGPVLVQLQHAAESPAPALGRRIWRGTFDQLVIGRGPRFAAIEATAYPDDASLLRAAAAAPKGDWSYSAATSLLLPGLAV